MTIRNLLKSIKGLKDESDKDLFDIAITGIEEGYPPCCIIAFCKDLGQCKSPSKRALNHSGFIPCQKHHKEYKNKVSQLRKLRVTWQ